MAQKRRRARRWWRGAVLALATAALLLPLYAAPPAEATKLHPFEEIFGSAAQPTFTAAAGIAVDQSTGDVLVMDAAGPPSIKRYHHDGTAADFSALGSNVIDGVGPGDETPQPGLAFDAAGESQIAVDNSGTATDGNIYVTDSPNLIYIFSSAGTYLGRLTKAGATNFTEACGVAVGPDGAVYVGDYTSGIHKFVPTGNPPVDADYVTTFSSVFQPCTLAAGDGPSAGSLFAATFNGPISKIDADTGTLESTVSTGSYATITSDPATGHVYGVKGSSIEEFDGSAAQGAPPVAAVALPSSGAGAAVWGSTGEIYASRSGSAQLEVFSPAVATVPEVVTGAVTENAGATATLNGTVDPDGVELSECFFEYGETSAYGQTVPCTPAPAAIGSGTGPVAVQAEVAGLSFATGYHYRLVAANPTATAAGADLTFETPAPPTIEADWTAAVEADAATLKATINPNGAATTAWVEYGTDATYGSTSAPVPVGADKSPHTVAIRVAGLQPETSYHYRVLTSNSAAEAAGGPIAGPDRTFRTYAPSGAPGLPDQRAYEMVSPLEKNGGDIGGSSFGGGELATAFGYSAADGHAITYMSLASFGDSPSAKLLTQYFSTRTPSGWTTHSISPPAAGPSRNLEDLFAFPYSYFSADLSAGVLETKAVLVSGAPEGFHNLYLRDTLGGGYRLVTTVVPPSRTPENYNVDFAGASADLGHVVFQADDALTATAPLGARSVYEWIGDSALRLVSVLPGPEETAAPSAGAGDGSGNFLNAVSADGSRIFWTDDAGQLYVREDGTTTIKLNVSHRSPSLGDGTAIFRAAAADGSRVIFTDSTPLTDEAGDNGGLYEYDFADGSLHSLSPGGSAPEVEGVVAASEDATAVYFVARAALADGAQAGAYNLYLARGDTLELIAVLGEEDSNDWTQNPFNRSAQATPDGGHLVFLSRRSLTGYDNADAATGTPLAEVFVYDAALDLLRCASCNPGGSRPIGAAQLPTSPETGTRPRYITADGSRVFFDSADALLPRDTNGRRDVYEYEDGALHLISPGNSDGISALVDVTPDGDDVFFTTRSRLVPEDQDENSDMYDARVGGGFPPPLSSSTPCSEESCRGPISTPAAAAAIRTAGTAPDPEDSAPARKRRGCRAKAGHRHHAQARPKKHPCRAKHHPRSRGRS